MSTSVTGRIVRVEADGTTFDMAEEGSVSFDAGESVNDFEPAAKKVSETFHEVASPTLDWTTTIDPDAAGLDALGVVDEDGNIVYADSRRFDETDDVKVEYVDGDAGTVESVLEIPAGTVEWEGVDGQTPPTMDFTIHINEAPTFDTDPGTQ